MTTETLDARRFRALQQDRSSENLARFFLLTPEDMFQVRTCRGAANRFGFALNLLLLRFLYCLCWLLGTSVLVLSVLRLIERAFLSKHAAEKYNHYGLESIDFLLFCLF